MRFTDFARIIISIFFFCISQGGLTQTLLNGLVVDEQQEPVIGANVFLKGTYDGASTDEHGQFSFLTSEKGNMDLMITYLGYEPFSQTLNLTIDSIFTEVQLKPTANELNMVVISAGAFEASDEKKSVVLRPLDIVLTAGATADIAGALNTLPGTQAVGEEGKLFVRGGAAYETQTFIDGMLVPSPYSSSVPNLPARGRFSPFLFKGTTFSTGGYSAEYGQALSSALLLETQDLAPETVSGISLMTVGLEAAHTQRWENSSLALSLDHTNLAPYVGLVPQKINWEKPFRGTGGRVIFRHKTSETGMLKFQTFGNHSLFELHYPDENNVLETNLLKLTNDNQYYNASYREILGDKWSLFGGLAYSLNRDLIQEKFKLTTDARFFQSKIRLNYQANEQLRIKGGLSLWSGSFDEKYRQGEGAFFHTRFEDNLMAGFLEADQYLGSKMVIRFGLRMEHSSLLQKSNLAPRLSLAYKAGEYSQFSLAYGRFSQRPENELMRYDQKFDFEEAQHFILNYQLMRKDRSFRVEAYYKTYDKLVKFDPELPWITSNSGKGYARGLDLFYRDRTWKNGDFWLSYSFLDTKRDYRHFPTSAIPHFASRHNASAVYKHWISSMSTSVGLTYSFASPRPFNDPNKPGFNLGRTPVYQDLSINMSYLTQLFGQFTILYASLTNVPGFKNNFGYRFSDIPGEDGQFSSIPIEPPAKRFFFLGLFISIGENGNDTTYF